MSDLFVGHSIKSNNPVSLSSDDLTTHAVLVGHTGSGKTSLLHVLVEECALAGTSVVVLDSKGDITNLAIPISNLTPEEFAPWVEKGKNPEEEARRWIEGIESSGQSLSRVATLRNSAEFSVYTPGLAGQQSINLLTGFEVPTYSEDESVIRERASLLVNKIMSALGSDTDPMTDPGHVYLTELLLNSWRSGNDLPLEQWSGLVITPPESLDHIDGIDINDFFPPKERIKLARSLIGFRRQAAKWLTGTPLNIENFINKTENGLPKVSIFTLRHLNTEDRQMFISMFLSSMVDWMYHTQASSELKCLCVIDEASTYLPPIEKPPTKRPIMTLISQGRASGLGMLLATQNPNDLDYKALSNIGTWFVGGLRKRDLERDLEAIFQQKDIDSDQLLDMPQRGFLMIPKEGEPQVIKARWALSYLRGPLNADQLNFNQQLSDCLDISFNIISDDQDPVDASVLYMLDGDTYWLKATPSSESPSMERLKGSSSGINYTFIWNTVADFGHMFVPNIKAAVYLKDRGVLDIPPFDLHNEIL
jgi:Helicase HerA, central domain